MPVWASGRTRGRGGSPPVPAHTESLAPRWAQRRLGRAPAHRKVDHGGIASHAPPARGPAHRTRRSFLHRVPGRSHPRAFSSVSPPWRRPTAPTPYRLLRRSVTARGKRPVSPGSPRDGNGWVEFIKPPDRACRPVGRCVVVGVGRKQPSMVVRAPSSVCGAPITLGSRPALLGTSRSPRLSALYRRTRWPRC